ncbi:DUF732 domain-containing protein [Nocardia sp. NPDC050408]|uniref:DUF732 domain-containing protein n=1 Tax=unclassified Nocardia TaxID=2637762 RepID=UPI0034224F52
MFGHRLSRTIASALIAATAGIGGVAVAATATAAPSAPSTTSDARFLNLIRQEGIGFASLAAAIGDAHHVCRAIAGGQTPVAVSKDILHNTDLTTRQSAVFVVASVDTYCPQYHKLLAA